MEDKILSEGARMKGEWQADFSSTRAEGKVLPSGAQGGQLGVAEKGIVPDQ